MAENWELRIGQTPESSPILDQPNGKSPSGVLLWTQLKEKYLDSSIPI